MTKDHKEVCPFSREVLLQPLSAPLQDSIRFFLFPLPAFHRSLRFDCPLFRARIRAYRVLRSEQMSDLGPVFPPVGVVVSVIPNVTEITYPRTFWCKPVSNFGLCYVTMFIDSSLVLAMSPQPSPLSACCWQIQRFLTDRPTVSCGYFSDSFTQKDCSDCMCRWAPLTEQRVRFNRTFQLHNLTSHYIIVIKYKKTDCR